MPDGYRIPSDGSEPKFALKPAVLRGSDEDKDNRDPDSYEARQHDGREWEPAESEMATQAEEPIEDRLRRAWLNGFTEGVNRGAWGTRWDR